MSKTKQRKQQKVRNKSTSISIDQSKRSSISLGRFLDGYPNALPFALIGLGLVLLSYFGLHRYFIWRSLTLSAQEIRTLPSQPHRPAEPAKIYIQWFVDAPVESMSLIGTNWSISPDKVSYLVQSARPGEAGNIILYGHNTRQILGNIRALKGSERITISTADGTAHHYQVTQMKETDPNDVDWLQATDTEVLTMYTCSGLLDSKRFIVRALPIQN